MGRHCITVHECHLAPWTLSGFHRLLHQIELRVIQVGSIKESLSVCTLLSKSDASTQSSAVFETVRQIAAAQGTNGDVQGTAGRPLQPLFAPAGQQHVAPMALHDHPTGHGSTGRSGRGAFDVRVISRDGWLNSLLWLLSLACTECSKGCTTFSSTSLVDKMGFQAFVRNICLFWRLYPGKCHGEIGREFAKKSAKQFE